MMNRYVIALNRVNIAQEELTTHAEENKENKENKLTIYEVAKLMDKVRKYPENKIEREELFTCGFSIN